MHSLATSNQAYTSSAKSLLHGGRRPASKLSYQQDQSMDLSSSCRKSPRQPEAPLEPLAPMESLSP